MPIPRPYKNEKQDEFISRCMADEVMVKEYQDGKQRFAICQTQWENRKKLAEVKEVTMADVQEIIGNEYVELDGVEILNTYPNSHNIKFTKLDLLEIKNNFQKLKDEQQLIPIVKVSHSDQQALLKKLFGIEEVDSYEEMPLLGIVEELELSNDGNSLKAKISKIPAKLKDVFGKMFKAVSPEIVFNWRGTGQKVLRAIALTNMPSQKHITDVAMSEGLSCGSIIIIQEEVKTMSEPKDVKTMSEPKDVKTKDVKIEETLNDENFIRKLSDKLGITKPKQHTEEVPANKIAEKSDAVVLSLSQYEEIKKEMNEMKKKLMEKDEQQNNFSESISKLKEQARNEKAEALCSKALNDGVPKVVVDKLKPLLMSEIGEQTIKLSKVVDDKPIEAEVSVFEIVKDFFANYPGQKVDFGEKTVTELSAPSEDSIKSIRVRAQEYMKQGMSEHEALMKAGQEILK